MSRVTGKMEARALLRLAVFFFVLFTTHWLLHLLHPSGVLWFFSGLALGTLAASLAISHLIPLLERKVFRGNWPRSGDHPD